MISLDQARAHGGRGARKERAARMGLSPVVGPLDAGGHLLAFEAGGWRRARGGSRSPAAKAYGAVMLGMPGSFRWRGPRGQGYFQWRPVNGDFPRQAGDGAGRCAGGRDGAVVGAVGVTRDTSDNDAAAAVARDRGRGVRGAGVSRG